MITKIPHLENELELYREMKMSDTPAQIKASQELKQLKRLKDELEGKEEIYKRMYGNITNGGARKTHHQRHKRRNRTRR